MKKTIRTLLLIFIFVSSVYGDEQPFKKGDYSAWAYWQGYCEQIANAESFFKKTSFQLEIKKCLCNKASYKKHCIGKSSK